MYKTDILQQKSKLIIAYVFRVYCLDILVVDGKTN